MTRPIFEPGDLQALLEFRFGPQPDHVGRVVAEFCNAHLASLGIDAETLVVYGPQSFYGFPSGAQQSWHTKRNPGHTHQARLVDIKPIEKGEK